MVIQGCTLGIDAVVFISIDSFLLSIAGMLSLLPVVILATRVAPLGHEGFVFSSLISLYDLGATIGGYFSAALVSHHLSITALSN